MRLLSLPAVCLQLIRRAPGLQGSALALASWSFASLRHGHTGLFGALSARAISLAGEGRLRPQDARQLLYAAAKLGVRDTPLLRACAQVGASELTAA
jgi:hypothetical protein